MKAIIKVENLSRCKNFTLNVGRGSNIKYKPYVFTERIVYVVEDYGVSKYAPVIADSVEKSPFGFTALKHR